MEKREIKESRKTKKGVEAKKKMRLSFEKKRVEELINAEAPDLWRSFKDGILKACDELCRKEGSIQTPVKKTRS